MLTDLDETWYEWSLGQARRRVKAAFLIGHQGAAQFAVKGENLGVFANMKDYDNAKASSRGLKAPWDIYSVAGQWGWLSLQLFANAVT